LQELKRQGLSISQIGALTGFDTKTIRRYLRESQTPTYGPRSARPSKLDPYKPYIEERLKIGVWNAVVLLREIKEQGYSGKCSILKDYLRPLRRAASVVAVRRFETPPGHQGQVDWGELGEVVLTDGTVQKLSGFVLTLGYSRAIFADVATDQRLVTFLRMHEAAFQELGGVPAEILYDRVKTVVLGVDERGEIQWHPTFRDLASYWGFIPRLCRAYRPQTKGKVESGIKYVRGNFLCGREADSVDELHGQLHSWVWRVANVRVHGTTHRQIRQAWTEEKAHLMPLVVVLWELLWYCRIMVTQVMTCPDCQGQNVIRYGHTRGGHPRYHCKDCRRYFSEAPERGHSPEFEQQVLAAYQERSSMRGIAGAFHISGNTLTNWLKQKGGSCPT
jgi:transposase/transposase-like protein